MYFGASLRPAYYIDYVAYINEGGPVPMSAKIGGGSLRTVSENISPLKLERAQRSSRLINHNGVIIGYS